MKTNLFQLFLLISLLIFAVIIIPTCKQEKQRQSLVNIGPLDYIAKPGETIAQLNSLSGKWSATTTQLAEMTGEPFYPSRMQVTGPAFSITLKNGIPIAFNPEEKYLLFCGSVRGSVGGGWRSELFSLPLIKDGVPFEVTHNASRAPGQGISCPDFKALQWLSPTVATWIGHDSVHRGLTFIMDLSKGEVINDPTR